LEFDSMSTEPEIETTPSATTAVPTSPASSLPRKRVDLAGNIIATGRRKSAIARVRLRSGSGVITVNKRPLDVYFPSLKDREQVSGALGHVGQEKTVDVDITVTGGGAAGQAGACRLGIARSLLHFDTELAEPLRQGGFLTRDGRMKERKKYGLRGARRGTQFSKR
jgi:small subunit ribosomal protein S9